MCTLQEVYEFLDENIRTSLDSKCISHKVYRLIDKFNQNEGEILKIILGPLFIMVENGTFKPMIEMKDREGNAICIPDMSNFDNRYADILKERVALTNNLFIKARYAHTIWQITKDINYAKIAVDTYLGYIAICEEYDRRGKEKYAGLEVVDSFENARSLAIPTKYNIEAIEEKALYLLFEYYPSSSNNSLIKNSVVEFLIKYVQKGLFKKEILNGVSEICEDYRLKEDDSFCALTFIDYGRKIAGINKQNTIQWDLKEAAFYESLMKKEGQELVAPEYCQKALAIYRKLKIQEKIDELSSLYPELTKSINLHAIDTPSIDLKEGIEYYENLAKEFNSEEIISFLLNGDNIPDYANSRAEAEKILQTSLTAKIVSTRLFDKFGNTKDTLETDEDHLLYQTFMHYDIFSQIQAKFLTAFINECILLKKLNAKTLVGHLKKNSWFGYNLVFQRMNNQEYKYKWLDFIEDSLCSYLGRLEKNLINNEPQYPLFIQEIDCLVLKIEGMIRDLVRIKNLKGFSIYKFSRNCDTEIVAMKDINTLLWDKNIFEVLPQNDVWFLRYFLIESFNLRNDIAHSLYLSPNEYNIYTMNLMLIAILRLSRFKLKTSE